MPPLFVILSVFLLIASLGIVSEATDCPLSVADGRFLLYLDPSGPEDFLTTHTKKKNTPKKERGIPQEQNKCLNFRQEVGWVATS